jgi:hypothetical protein
MGLPIEHRNLTPPAAFDPVDVRFGSTSAIGVMSATRPLSHRKRKSGNLAMSQKCPQKRTRAPQQKRHFYSIISLWVHLRLHFRARGVVDTVQPEHAVILAAGQLLSGVLIARGPPDAIKMHRGVTGTRDHVHAAAVALDQAAQT